MSFPIIVKIIVKQFMETSTRYPIEFNFHFGLRRSIGAPFNNILLARTRRL